MKIRLDFVTNSSSSSFTCVALYSEELYTFLQKLIAEKKYREQPEWSKWARPEEELHIDYVYEELKFDKNWYKVQTTEEYGRTDKESVYQCITYFFNGLTPEEKQTLKDLVFEVYKKREYETHKYEDQTDGFVGFDFKTKLTKADKEGGSKEGTIQKLLSNIGEMAVDPETVDLSMRSIAINLYRIDGHGIYDPESGRYKHIDKSFLNQVRYSWDYGFTEEYNNYQLEEKKEEWGKHLRELYKEALDDIGTIVLGNISSRSDYAVVIDSVDGAVSKYDIKDYAFEHYNLSRYTDELDRVKKEDLDRIKENCYIQYLNRIINELNEANKNKGEGEPPVAVIWESQLHSYLMNHSSLGDVTPKPVIGPKGTVRRKVPDRHKKTIDYALTEMMARWPSRIINPKTKTYEKLVKSIEGCRRDIGYSSVDEFFDAYGFSVKQEAVREHTNKYGDFEYEIKNHEITITKYTGTEAKVTLPDSIDGMPVKTIGKEAFRSNKSIKEVTVPESVVIMRGQAFSFCRNLRKVRLSNNISKIVSETFDGCESLEEINIPDMVRELPSGLFKDCPLRTIHIGKALQDISRRDFFKGEIIDSANMTRVYRRTCAIESITIDPENKNLKSIDSMILSYDGKILLAMLGDPYCKIPDGVEIIADAACQSQGFLRKVAFPASLRVIGNNAFSSTDLESVSFPSELKAIGSFAFFQCTNISDLALPEGLEEIYRHAFWGTSIRSITIPNSMKTLGEYSFDFWHLDNIEPVKWKRAIRSGNYSKNHGDLNTTEFIEKIKLESRQAEVDSLLENKTGLGLLALMMACLQSDEANKYSFAERLKLEQAVISKEMDCILGTNLKLMLSYYQDKATDVLIDCIKYLKTKADKSIICEYGSRIRKDFPEMDTLLNDVIKSVGEEE